MRILSVGTAVPPHHVDQDTLIAGFERLWAREHHNVRRVRQLHTAVHVGGRNLALPMDAYEQLRGFGDANDAFIRVGLEVGAEALQRGLDGAGLGHADVDAMYTATVTGVATPSLDARLFHRVPLRADLKRVPLFGLGCVAGAAGISRVSDYLRAWPDQIAVLLSVELCSLTLQRRDLSVANLIASGLFGDGSAAVVCAGEARYARDFAAREAPGAPQVVATASRMYPDSERVMGWDIGEEGFRVVLDRSVPDVVTTWLRGDVDGFLAGHGLTRADIQSWVCHPGGPKVLKAFEQALELSAEALAVTWDSLFRVGNLSSASVLFVLEETMRAHRPPPGSWGMMLAMGPGFCSELVLLRW
ncbi:MAG TPA: 3-oxoacyl-[acyl-carrier-protein] synthase III C-terminal domain-containing protein [Myxococcota bacterium]|nr:3-oxoacyl-[acyl-carrier-protein] synthase III C-terminal domain-containing protein [Myxococcota bacterium]